jgi:hypothetical protein
VALGFERTNPALPNSQVFLLTLQSHRESRRGTGLDTQPGGSTVRSPTAQHDDERPQPGDDPDEAPETPTDEPQPVPVQDPPAEPDPSPYVVRGSGRTASKIES